MVKVKKSAEAQKEQAEHSLPAANAENCAGCIPSLEEASPRYSLSLGETSSGLYSPKNRPFEPHPQLLHTFSTWTLQTPRACEEPSLTQCVPSSQKPYFKAPNQTTGS